MYGYIKQLDTINYDISVALDIAFEFPGMLSNEQIEKARKDLRLGTYLTGHAKAGHWRFRKDIEAFIERNRSCLEDAA